MIANSLARFHIQDGMEPEQSKRLQSPLRKLRKSLKKIAKKVTPKRTHDLRTHVRQSETVVSVALDGTREGKRLLKAVKPLYKMAGKVRDMDVLTTLAATVESDGEEECMAQLLEALVSWRERAVRKLQSAVTHDRRKIDRHLRQCGARIEKEFAAAGGQSQNGGGPPGANPVALRLAAKLGASPSLGPQNLHPYRRKVKELRYLLTLAGDEDAKLTETLGDVKDAIGTWHDWAELDDIAAKVLDHGPQCKLRKQIESAAKSHFDQALSQASALQKKSFRRAAAARRSR
ncbi:MAG: CHAD domain-containing protein [Acidobacteriaceae bacterium]